MGIISVEIPFREINSILKMDLNRTK